MFDDVIKIIKRHSKLRPIHIHELGFDLLDGTNTKDVATGRLVCEVKIEGDKLIIHAAPNRLESDGSVTGVILYKSELTNPNLDPEKEILKFIFTELSKWNKSHIDFNREAIEFARKHVAL